MSTWTSGGSGNGIIDLNCGPFPDGVINRHSVVQVSIVEVTGEALDIPFLGGATMTVHNVNPRDDNSLSVRLSIDWDSPLWYQIAITIG